MQFNLVFLASALLASASVAMSATITGFSGPECTGSITNNFTLPSRECFSLEGDLVESVGYSGVPTQIVLSVGGSCANDVGPVHPGPSGCLTAPAGFHWGSVVVV